MACETTSLSGPRVMEEFETWTIGIQDKTAQMCGGHKPVNSWQGWCQHGCIVLWSDHIRTLWYQLLNSRPGLFKVVVIAPGMWSVFCRSPSKRATWVGTQTEAPALPVETNTRHVDWFRYMGQCVAHHIAFCILICPPCVSLRLCLSCKRTTNMKGLCTCVHKTETGHYFISCRIVFYSDCALPTFKS